MKPCEASCGVKTGDNVVQCEVLSLVLGRKSMSGEASPRIKTGDIVKCEALPFVLGRKSTSGESLPSVKAGDNVKGEASPLILRRKSMSLQIGVKRKMNFLSAKVCSQVPKKLYDACIIIDVKKS